MYCIERGITESLKEKWIWRIQTFCLQKWATVVANPMQEAEHHVGKASREPGMVG